MKKGYIFALILALCLSLGGAVAAQAASPAESRSVVLLDKGKGSGDKGKGKDPSDKGIAQKELNFSGVAKTVAVCLLVGAVAGAGVGLSRRQRHAAAAPRPRPRAASRSAYYRPARKGERYGRVPDYVTAAAEEAAPDFSEQTQILRAPGTPAEDWGQTQILRTPAAPSRPGEETQVLGRAPEEGWQPLSAWDTPPAGWQPAAPGPKPENPAPGPAPIHPSMEGTPFAAFDDLYIPAGDGEGWMKEPEEPIVEDDEPGDVNFII